MNYNNPSIGGLQQQQTPVNFMGQQAPVQYPYGNNNITLYDNYMGRMNGSQNLLSNQFLKCRPVSSRDEARAYQIDLDGSLWVFTDVGNGKIYTKQVNNDGTASFKTYAFAEDEKPYSSDEYVTKEEFNRVVQTLMAAMRPGDVQESASVQSNSQDQGKAVALNF